MNSIDKVEPTRSSGDTAQSILLGMARLTPGRLLLCMWLCLLVGNALTALRVTSGLGVALGLTALCGYSYALILGLPDGVIRKSVVSATRKLLALFFLVLAILVVAIPFVPNGYSTPMSPSKPGEWLELFFGVVVNAVVFGPFFLGAAALNDLRQAMKQPNIYDSVPNFLALFFGLFGGAMFAHRPVRQFFGFEPRPAVDSRP